MKSIIIPLVVTVVGVAIQQTIAYFASEHNDFRLTILASYTTVVQWIVYVHAGGFFGNERTEKFYDLTGAFTYLSTLGLNFYLSKNIPIRQIILSSLSIVWAVRLGMFLFVRICNNSGVDSRFTQIKANNYRFLMAWTLQGLWCFLTIIPVLIASHQESNPTLNYLDYIGFSLWTFGFIFEIVSDDQKRRFRSNSENKEKFIKSGLWSISRHPNYFGEIVLWIGASLSAFSGTKSFYVFISPVFVSLLLVFVSGIPLLEQKANEHYGKDKSYQDYKKSTPVLVPFIGRRGSAKF